MKIDISDDVEFKNGRGNPFGWSQEEIWHNGRCIGFLESGAISIYEPCYSSEVIQETDKRKRGVIYFDKQESDKNKPMPERIEEVI